MQRTLIRILDQRKAGTVLGLFECGHRRWLRKWRGKMMHDCDDCTRGMMAQPIPKGEIVKQDQSKIAVKIQ